LVVVTCSTHFIVVSHPYDEDGNGSDLYQVLKFDYPKVSQTNVFFNMGRNNGFNGNIAINQLGTGLSVSANGTLGVFRIDLNTGSVVVIEASFTFPGGFYPCTAVFDSVSPLQTAWLLDCNLGGSIGRLDIDKDSNVKFAGVYLRASLPSSLQFISNSPKQLALLSSFGGKIELFDWTQRQLISSVKEPFGDDTPIVSAFCISPDLKHIAILDDNQFSGKGNRMVTLPFNLQNQSFGVPTIISPVDDPAAVVCSNAGTLVAAAQGNAILQVDWQKIVGSATVGPAPQLPTGLIGVQNPEDDNSIIVLTVEVTGIRQILFNKNTLQSKDLGVTSIGDDFQNMVGAIGVI